MGVLAVLHGEAFFIEIILLFPRTINFVGRFDKFPNQKMLQVFLQKSGGDQVVRIQNFKIFAKSEFKISKFLKFRIAKCKLWTHIWKNRQVQMSTKNKCL